MHVLSQTEVNSKIRALVASPKWHRVTLVGGFLQATLENPVETHLVEYYLREKNHFNIEFTSDPTELEVILGAAQKSPEGEVMVATRPGRHHSCGWAVRSNGLENPDSWQQGFFTSHGRYVDRREAADIAITAGQILEGKLVYKELFSEDIWGNS